MTPRPAASARVPRWRVDASRAVSPRACLGGAGGPPGTQVGLLGPGCAAVPVPGGRVGQKIPAQYTLLTHTVRRQADELSDACTARRGMMVLRRADAALLNVMA